MLWSILKYHEFCGSMHSCDYQDHELLKHSNKNILFKLGSIERQSPPNRCSLVFTHSLTQVRIWLSV